MEKDKKNKLSKLFDKLIVVYNDLESIRYDRMEGYDERPLTEYFTEIMKLIKKEDNLILQIENISGGIVNMHDIYKSKQKILSKFE